MFAARAAIGASTAGGSTPTVSMIADLFPLPKRGFAMGIFSTAGLVGSAASLPVAAAITVAYDWRVAMFIFGAAGILVAVLLLYTVSEPVRRNSAGESVAHENAPQILEVTKFFRKQRSLVHLTIAFSLTFAVDIIVSNWSIQFFVRSHSIDLQQVSILVAAAFLIGGIPRAFLGGYLLDLLTRFNIRWHCWLCAGAAAMTIPSSLIAFLSPTTSVAFLAFTLNAFLLACIYAPTVTLPTGLLKNRMRAMGFAIVAAVMYSVYGISVTVVGYVSELLRPTFGDQSLRYALLLTIVLLIWSVLHFWVASRTLEEDYLRANEE